MYLLYVDASGTPQLGDNSRHYVFLGIGIHEGAWSGLNERVERLKSRYCLAGRTFELHCAEFCVQMREQEAVPNFEALSWAERLEAVLGIWRKRIETAADPRERRRLEAKFREHEPFVHLTRTERSRLLEESLDLVGSHDGIRLFAEAVAKAHPAVADGFVDPMRQAFEQVVSRFDTFLGRRHQWRLQRSDRPPVDKGLLILDRDYATEATVRHQFDGFRKEGHTWGPLRHVIDVPFFASSAQLPGLQLADVCAYALRRYLDKGAVPGSPEERNFQRIAHRFDQGSHGRLHGVRHYVPAGNCHCWICQRRGHSGPPTLPQQP